MSQRYLQSHLKAAQTYTQLPENETETSTYMDNGLQRRRTGTPAYNSGFA